ncbi:two-component response regulator ARR2-like [Solanum lycopersicum]|uniref:two-component response regulator ARR2-like n=1 Tax=Solanum lycopersicum TaxID=4081 RepID=UPI003749F46F
MSTSGACMNSGEFPTFRLLVVDDDTFYLNNLEQTLKKCQYEVTTCNRAEDALSLLRDNKNNFHLVIIDVHMPDMDGFELLKHIVLEMNLPVVMMSADDSRSVAMKCVIDGAHYCLIKPVSMESLQNIWQHIVRQNKDEWKCKILDQSGDVEQPKEVEYSCVTNEVRLKSSKKKRAEGYEMEERSDTTTLKKARTTWSAELHRKFLEAVDFYGINKVVPKKILERMNVAGLKREQVASHLQKHRLIQRKNQSEQNNACMGDSEATIGTMSNRFQPLAPISQFPAQNLAIWGRPATNSPMFVPLADQRNHFSFENSMLRYQGQQQMNNRNEQTNLLYGIPTAVEQNPSYFGMNMPVGRISQPQLQAHNMLRESNKFLSQNGLVHNPRDSMYNQFPRASSSAIDCSLNQNISFAGSTFPMSGNSATSTTKEDVNSDDIFNELYQENVGSTLDTSYHSSIHHGIWSMEQSGQNVNSNTLIAEAVLCSGQEIGHVNPVPRPYVNAERYPSSSYQSATFPEPSDQDLMSAMLEQQQQESDEPVAYAQFCDDNEDALGNFPT